MKRSVLTSLIILAMFYGASALKCWSCLTHPDSHFNSHCEDPFDNTTVAISDCEVMKHAPALKTSMCLKIKQKLNGGWHFNRTCVFLESPTIEDHCTTTNEPNGMVIETCLCNSRDGCNSATTSTLSWYSSIFLFMFGTYVISAERLL